MLSVNTNGYRQSPIVKTVVFIANDRTFEDLHLRLKPTPELREAVLRMSYTMKIVFCLFCLLTRTFSSKITGYKSTTEATCDEHCLKMVEKFKKEYSHGWAIRHPSISAHYAKSNCRVCVEIGVARGELSHYLLKNLDHQIEEYYAIDPFLGGYDDKNDAMSVELTLMNSPQVWACSAPCYVRVR